MRYAVICFNMMKIHNGNMGAPSESGAIEPCIFSPVDHHLSPFATTIRIFKCKRGLTFIIIIMKARDYI